MKGQIIKTPKGTKDMLPEDSYKWHFLEEKIKKVAKLYNAKEIRTPIFEHTELFLRGVGKNTDIVNKEMYTFEDKASRSITLKPEGTAGVVRSYIENGLFNQPQPIKNYYISPIFRYERPQKGRLRQHHQFGVEYFGSSSPLADAEVISIAVDFFKEIGIENITVNINSIGNSTDRENYKKVLKEHFINKLDSLCKDCQNRYHTNVLRLLDCKVDQDKQAVLNAPSILDSLGKESKEHFEKVQKALQLKNIKYKINDKVVRGLDYYTGTVFEVEAQDIKGPSKVICGGGRYDDLVESLGGKPTQAVGFGIGLERILLLLEQFNTSVASKDALNCYIAKVGLENSLIDAKLANKLRSKGLTTEIDLLNRSLNAQLKYASKLEASYVAIIGEEELKDNKVKVKNMKTGKEESIKINELTDYLIKEIKQ